MLSSTTNLAARRRSSLRASRRGGAGFTFVELVITLGIITILSGIAIPALGDAIKAAKSARAVADVRTIGQAAYGFYAETGAAPNSLADIGFDQQVDPWGHRYLYQASAQRKDRFGVAINQAFDLCSLGPDGLTDTSLDAAPSQDDVIWANDGYFIGLSLNY